MSDWRMVVAGLVLFGVMAWLYERLSSKNDRMKHALLVCLSQRDAARSALVKAIKLIRLDAELISAADSKLGNVHLEFAKIVEREGGVLDWDKPDCERPE